MDTAKKIVIIATHGEESPDRATLPYLLALPAGIQNQPR